MDKLTPDALVTFLWVGAALVAFTLAIWSLLDKIKSAKKPAQELAAWKSEMDRKQEHDHRRIDSLDEGQKAISRGMLALLNHQITGNSVDKLKEAQTELTDYLINR